MQGAGLDSSKPINFFSKFRTPHSALRNRLVACCPVALPRGCSSFARHSFLVARLGSGKHEVSVSIFSIRIVTRCRVQGPGWANAQPLAPKACLPARQGESSPHRPIPEFNSENIINGSSVRLDQKSLWSFVPNLCFSVLQLFIP